VPDGSYLVINTADEVGNSSSTLLIVDNRTATNVDLTRAGLAGFDFSAIDLTFAPDARLTITEAQLNALTGPDRELVIKGDAGDTVTMTGAVETGATETIDGQTYTVYTLGSGGAKILLDDDIQSVI
jgi:large repetitive protein